MKVGSLVECVGIKVRNPSRIWVYPVPVKNQIYTVRMIKYDSLNGATIVSLEEIVNPICYRDIEYGYNIEDFREIQPPMEIKLSDFILEKQKA